MVGIEKRGGVGCWSVSSVAAISFSDYEKYSQAQFRPSAVSAKRKMCGWDGQCGMMIR